MSRFKQLLSAGTHEDPAQEQEAAEREFPGTVDASLFHLWRVGDPIADSGQRCLIGVATYSESDLALLDELEIQVSDARSTVRIDLFSVLSCSKHDDFDEYISEIGNVYQTPVVGLWIDGTLVAKGQGVDVVRGVLQKHGILT